MTAERAIDWAFISAREGGPVLRGYVPAATMSRSGVTIATGVDLGQRHPSELVSMDISDALKARLARYCGLTGATALQALEHAPLKISIQEARQLDEAVGRRIIDDLRHRYDHAAGRGLFDTLPGGMQTAIASVAYQYGCNLARRTPRFWAAAVRQDWQACIAELENFGDAYPTRRRAEAALMRRELLRPGPDTSR